MSKGTRGACSRPRKVGGWDNQQEEQGFLKFYWKNKVELQSLNIAARHQQKLQMYNIEKLPCWNMC